MRRSVLPLACLALAVVGLPPEAAFAQYSPGSNLRGAANPQIQGQTNRPPPAALPGLASRQTPAPIPGDPNRALSPNAALFDAINRGDLAAAREAMTRGADLDARNVLGLTALDAAVDQGRNDIMFFLLSVRSTATSSRGGPPDDDEALTRPARRPAQRQARRAPEPEAEPAPVAVPVPAAPVVRSQPHPRIGARDGGSASPDAGFLGFDAGSSGTTAPDRRRGG